jgi:hypothetical protein
MSNKPIINRGKLKELYLKGKIAYLSKDNFKKEIVLDNLSCFAITGTGRCGTAFLAHALNTSPSYSVIHEYDYDYLIAEKSGYIDIVKHRFRDHYGEVNSHLRFIFSKLKVPKKAVIIRHPHEIILSAMNRHEEWIHGNDFVRYIDRLNGSLHILHNEIKKGTYLIRFEKMISDINVIIKLCEYLNINDIDFSRIALDEKVNKNKKIRYTTLSKFDEREISKLNWFIKRYY